MNEDTKEYLSGALEGLREGILGFDNQGRRILCNEAGRGWLDAMSAAGTLEDEAGLRLLVVPDFSQLGKWDALPHVKNFVLKREGHPITHLQVEARPWRLKSGQWKGHLCVIRDVSEETRQAPPVREAKLETMRTLTAGVAHDYNNILTVISGYTEVALGKAEGRMKDYLHAIKKACQQATDVTAQLLTFSQGLEAQLGREVLPLSRREAASGASKEPPQCERILLVEDSEVLRECFQAILTEQGYTVFASASAPEAMAWVDKEGAPDLLLTDVALPGMSGPEMSALLHRRYPTMKTVYCSGHPSEKLSHYGFEASLLTEILAKPFDGASLLAAVRRTLTAKSQAQ